MSIHDINAARRIIPYLSASNTYTVFRIQESRQRPVRHQSGRRPGCFNGDGGRRDPGPEKPEYGTGYPAGHHYLTTGIP